MAKGKRTNPPREEAPRRDIAGNTQNARGGRQQRPLDPGERVVMNFRVTPELKQRLGRSAELSGRSLTQEIEFRLYKSFAEQDQAELFHSAVYNQKVAGLLAILTRVMRDVGAFASLYSTGSIDRAEWLRATKTLRRWLFFWRGPQRPPEADESLAALLARRDQVRAKQTAPCRRQQI